MNAFECATSRFTRGGKLLFAMTGAARPVDSGGGSPAAGLSEPHRSRSLVGFPAGHINGHHCPNHRGQAQGPRWGSRSLLKKHARRVGNLAAAPWSRRPSSTGHTLLLAGNASLVVNQHVFDNLPYNPTNDLAPVAQVAA